MGLRPLGSSPVDALIKTQAAGGTYVQPGERVAGFFLNRKLLSQLGCDFTFSSACVRGTTRSRTQAQRPGNIFRSSGKDVSHEGLSAVCQDLRVSASYQRASPS